MSLTDPKKQYKDSSNLKARGNLHAQYATKNWFDWVADQLPLTQDTEVADIGCGAGWFWLSAKKRYPMAPKLTLVDISEGMVSEALKNLTAATWENDLTGATADIVDLPFEANRFDTAIVMHMLYHVADPTRAIAEVRRILRPGGTIAITTNGDDNLRDFFEIGSHSFGGSARDPAAQTFSVSRATALLSDGFDNVTVHRFDDEYAISDGDDIVHYLTSFPPGSLAEPAQIEGLKRLVVARLSEAGGVLRIKREGAMITGQRKA